MSDCAKCYTKCLDCSERPKAFSNGYEKGYLKGEADAIDEFASMLIADLGIAGYTKDTRSGHETYMCYELLDAIEFLRERLKE